MFIEPRTSQRPLLWIGGGSQLADPKSPDVPKFVKSVKARTVRADGWIPRPTCPPPDIARDWAELQVAMREAGKDPSSTLVAHENFLHLVMTNDPVKAREEQHRAFLKVMSSERGPNYLESVYLFGTPDEIIASLQARVDAGVEYFFLHTMTPDPDQLQLWVDEIIPNVTFPATAGPVRRPPTPWAMTRRVGLIGKPLKRRHSQVMHDAAFDAAGIDARYVLLELEPDAVEDAVREARGPDWLGLGVTAPYKRVVAGLVDEVEADAETIGAVNNVVRTDDGRLVGFNTDAPGLPGRASSWRWVARSPAPTSSSPGPAAPPMPSCSPASRRAPAGDRRRIGRQPAATALVERFAGVGAGARSAVVLADPAFETALRSADLAVNATTVGMLDPGRDDPGRARCRRPRPSSTSSTSRPRRRCSRRRGPAACGRRTAPRCSSPRPPSRSSAGRVSAAWPTSCARPSPRSSPTRPSGLTMRLATIVEDGMVPGGGRRATTVSCELDGVRGSSIARHARMAADGLALGSPGLGSTPSRADAGVPLDEVTFGPAVPGPGRDLHRRPQLRRRRARPAAPGAPLIYGKAASSVAGHGATLAWDRSA